MFLTFFKTLLIISWISMLISDAHMPDMDGFKLFEHVGLEMDLPVIRTDGSWKIQKKRKDAKEEEDEGELENDDLSTSKKPCVVWSVELHQQFVTAVNQFGIDSMNFEKIFMASISILFYMILVDKNLSSRKRWTPTTIQLEKQHQVFDQFNGSPNKEMINNLKTELNQHGNVSEKNIVTWFCNMRAKLERKALINPKKDSNEIQVEIQISPKKTKPNNMEETSCDIVPSQEIFISETSEEEAKINRAKRKDMLNLKSIGNDNYIDDESDDDYLSQMSGSDSDIEVDNETKVSISRGIDVSH
ncbi:hypothetical protein IFM89_027829 [Coptis chinensis]|uniref:Homeobox domain-containing protein n=1 Tax=Coptis chinensis TaxID=261450 RepID=A0A835HEK9_9MAGN|nr:hypothetical protein IFM89_027829 [Coptis chinensis]